MSTVSKDQTLQNPVDAPTDNHTIRTDASVPRITEDGQVEQVKVEITQVSGHVVYEHQ